MRSAFVGREAESAVLAGCLDAIVNRRSRVVVCTGEPGIGKTRLAEEFSELARSRGVLTAWGVGLDSDAAPPFWPWQQVVRALAENVDLRALAREQGTDQDLATVAPDVFGAAARAVDPASAEPRFALFDACARLFRAITQQRPLAVVLDDVHWADEPSVRLLHHLARFCSDAQLVMLVNSRDTEQRHGPLLAALAREPASRELPLVGLADSAVARKLADVVGVEVADADVARVQAATAGNPFFVAEMGRMLVDRGASGAPIRITASVREAIDERLRRLSADCVPLLRAAAAIGREFPTTDLAAIAGSSVLRCLELLDEAIAAGFVEPGPATGVHRFVHALVRDAVEATAGSPEMVRLHRMAAETIEAFYGHRLGSRIFDLARHWAVAAVEGERGRAVEWIERAGAEAMRALAHEEAIRLYRQALDVGAGELADADRCRLLLALGSALLRAGDIAGRLDVCLEAAALARALRRPDLLAEAALVLESVGPTDSELLVRDLCAEALAALDSEAVVLRARVAARYAEALLFVAWFTDSGYELPRQASAQALTLAQECGDSWALGAALRSRRLACASPEGLGRTGGPCGPNGGARAGCRESEHPHGRTPLARRRRVRAGRSRASVARAGTCRRLRGADTRTDGARRAVQAPGRAGAGRGPVR